MPSTSPYPSKSFPKVQQPLTLTPQFGALSFASPERDSREADISLQSVGTARSEWLPELLRQSLPYLHDASKRVAETHYPHGIQNRREGPVGNYLQEYGVTGLRGTYALAAAQLATYADRDTVDEIEVPPNQQTDRFGTVLRTLTRIGFGRDPFNSTINDIEDGPAALVALREATPVVYLYLDSASWTENRRRLRVDALETIACLKRGYDVRLVASADIERSIRTRHPDWCDEHLTQNGPVQGLQDSRVATDDKDPAPPRVDPELWETVVELPPGKRFELLATIPQTKDQRRTVESIKSDSSLQMSPGTVDRYYRELEECGLVTVLEPSGSNEVFVTSDGNAAQQLLTEDYDLQHPTQTDLTDSLTHPPQSHTSKVCGGDGRTASLVGQSFEETLRATEGGLTGPKPRQLPLPDCWLDESSQFSRLSMNQLADGVTLVDEPIRAFDDGRVAYFGTRDSESHVIVQWGGALATAVRSAVTLLSDLAFNTALTRENLDDLLSGPNALDELRRCLQVGWVKSTTYSTLRRELQKHARSLLGELAPSKGNPEVWGRTMRQAHGLLTSATALFDAAGYDVTLHVRIPDTNQLSRDDLRYREFIQFVQNTVPKNYQYRGHSASRFLLETDGDKLKYRYSDIVDPDDLLAHPTANWVVVGPGATEFRDDVEKALEATPIREQVADGTELGIEIPVEVATTNNISSLRSVIESSLDRVDSRLRGDLDLDSVVRLCMYAHMDPDHGSLPAPADVSEMMLAADALTSRDERIGMGALVRGVGHVDPERIYPWLPPSARSIMAALFRSDEPVQRKEILEEADVSLSSYERHRSTLDELGLLTDVGEYRYEATVPGEWTSLVGDGEEYTAVDGSLQQYRLVASVEDSLYVGSHLTEEPHTVRINGAE
ncbi:hypothetical protein [Halobaculum rarum]|uniref:hypothetical protein n=1 Tax=Halobaculum rarum TaxID=3075122 RepID=UPI0032AF3B99